MLNSNTNKNDILQHTKRENTNNPEVEFRKKQGLLLKKARKHAQYSQEEVGKELGLSQDIISNVERGKQNVSPYKLLQFAKLYSKPVTFFYMTDIHK